MDLLTCAVRASSFFPIFDFLLYASHVAGLPGILRLSIRVNSKHRDTNDPSQDRTAWSISHLGGGRSFAAACIVASDAVRSNRGAPAPGRRSERSPDTAATTTFLLLGFFGYLACEIGRAVYSICAIPALV